VKHARSSFLAMIAAQIALGAAANAQTAPGPLIRIGSTPNDSYAEPFYAEDRGFFTRDGLNVTVEPFATGAGVTAALAGNAIDVGITNAISLANAYEHGVPFVFFAVAATYNPAEVALCVAADSPIQTAKDLNGKTIGTTAIRDSNSLHVVAWIDQNGGDSSTVHLVELPFSAMAPALKRGTVAAVPIAEPTLSTVMKEGGVRIIGHPMDVYGKHFMVGGWFARPDYLAANVALMRRLRTTIYSTAVWANAHPDESAVSLAKYAKLDPEAVRTMNRSPYGTALTPDMIQPYLDLGYKYKYIGRQLKATDLIAKL
jgi:NitT/TauT family transport system substrate-binding protein